MLQIFIILFKNKLKGKNQHAVILCGLLWTTSPQSVPEVIVLCIYYNRLEIFIFLQK